MQTAALIKRIVRTPNICGGKARIEGRRIRVRDIVNWFEYLHMSADEISHEYDLDLSDIYLALAYYHANQSELEKEWRGEDRFVEEMKLKYPSSLSNRRKNGRFKKPSRIHIKYSAQ
ncbi:MAG: DUF433 domain-containing protein [Bacteroidota bacterium]